MPVALPFAAAFGLIIGSFLNVVAYRLPRGESLATPGSHCPECDALLESPLVSQGQTSRCPACREHLTIPSDVLFNDEREQADEDQSVQKAGNFNDCARRFRFA